MEVDLLDQLSLHRHRGSPHRHISTPQIFPRVHMAQTVESGLGRFYSFHRRCNWISCPTKLGWYFLPVVKLAHTCPASHQLGGDCDLRLMGIQVRCEPDHATANLPKQDMQCSFCMFLHPWLDTLVSTLLSALVLSGNQGILGFTILGSDALFQTHNGPEWDGHSHDYCKDW